MFCPFDTAHIETAISHSLTLLVWCIIHFHHFKYHDPYNDSLSLTVYICPWQLGGCGYRLPALSHCFTPFITYRAFRGRDITNGYDSVKKRISNNDFQVAPIWYLQFHFVCDKLLLSIWIPPLYFNAVGEPTLLYHRRFFYCKLKQC